MAINAVSGFNAISPATTGKIGGIQGNDNNTVSFGDFLKNALDKANDMQVQSEKLLDQFAAGETDNIHQVTIAMEQADLALQFTMQVRNKILDAYSEIMRMQI